MANMVKTTEYPKNVKQIMLADNLQTELAGKVADTGVSAVGGKKIVKAGTPVYGDLKKRNTAFTVSGSGNPVGIVLHDVDVTEGTNNVSVVVRGTVDLEKVESEVAQALIAAEANLPRIILTTGSGNEIA